MAGTEWCLRFVRFRKRIRVCVFRVQYFLGWCTWTAIRESAVIELFRAFNAQGQGSRSWWFSECLVSSMAEKEQSSRFGAFNALG